MAHTFSQKNRQLSSKSTALEVQESDSTGFSGDKLTTLTGMVAHAIYRQEISDRKAWLGPNSGMISNTDKAQSSLAMHRGAEKRH